MSDYLIYIDASVDVEASWILGHDIRFIKMNYTIGGEACVLRGLETDEEMHVFYDRMRADEPASTSQITPFAYEEEFGPEIEKGNSILYIALSSGLSNTYDSSLLAVDSLREKYGDIHVECIDSRAATGGMGILLMRAIRNRDKGMTLEENAAELRATVPHLAHWFIVEDLKYLKAGGRISPTTAFVGDVLNIKPILKIASDGTLVTIGKQRGFAKSIKHMLDIYARAYDNNVGNDVIITHADVYERAVQLKERVLEINPEAHVDIRPLSIIIGSHTGPGMVTIDHFGDNEADKR